MRRQEQVNAVGQLAVLFKTLAAGLAVVLLLAAVVWLIPSERASVLILAPVLVGLGVGFVYGRLGGPALALVGVAFIFHRVAWDYGQPLSRNLVWFMLFATVCYVGFGLSRLVNRPS